MRIADLDDLGLIYMNARYYVPEVGRFASPDTIVPEPGNPQSFNRYSYVNNDPVNHTDPTGHWLESVVDLAFIAYDIYDIQQNGLNWTNGLALAADVASLAVPVVAGGGAVVRGIAHADDVGRALSHADDALKAASHVDDVRHARTSAGITQDVLNKVIPSKFDPDSRFGAALYVTKNGQTAIDELAAHGNKASHVIRYQLDLSKAKVLDLTNPEIAKAWGYVNDIDGKSGHQLIAQLAGEQGYNAIKFWSYRGQGYNYALLRDSVNPFNYDEWLIPQMVSPAP